jgi:uncharacterized membrane protein (UPF0127 family)
MPGSNPSGQFYVYNKTRETFVATETTVADDYFRRLIGLLGKTKRWAKLGRGLWIIPSRGVHTIGMLFPIDVLFLNKNKEVIHIEEHMRPFRISKVSLKTTSVLELPAHAIYRSGTKVGDRLEIASAR